MPNLKTVVANSAISANLAVFIAPPLLVFKVILLPSACNQADDRFHIPLEDDLRFMLLWDATILF
ncbi:MAG: hypothetical protein SVO26_08200 [Chloroflexota bacterium]|nr:hypothetical protein [Chloroflexota bacterium]